MLFLVQVSRFETVDGHCILATIDVQCEVFVGAFKDRIRSIIGWLEWLADCVVAYKHVGGGREASRNAAVLLCWTGERGLKGLHVCLQCGYVVRWIW